MLARSVFLCDSVRSPIGRFAGSLAGVRADDLAAHLLRALLRRNPTLDPGAVDEVYLGCANQAGEDNRNVARMAALLAGFPVSVPAATINRLCGSGMDAVGIAARAIASGQIEVAIAGGVESMSRAPFVMAKAETPFDRKLDVHDTTIGWRFVNEKMAALYGVDSMPETAEIVAAHFRISRTDQDAFAFRSQCRARAAIESGRLAEEIEPLAVPTRKGATLQIASDEQPRPETTMAALAALRTPFLAGGSVTAGNSSGINDGSAAMLLVSEDVMNRFALEPAARVLAMATAGVEPRLMGIGPVPATRKALVAAKLTLDSIGVIEVNEAFASQSLAVLRELGLPDDAEHVNPNGGAIALGHPLGMSGARIVMTAAREMRRRNASYALATMCVGVGQGVAIVLGRC